MAATEWASTGKCSSCIHVFMYRECSSTAKCSAIQQFSWPGKLDVGSSGQLFLFPCPTRTDLKIFGASCARNLLEKVRLTRVSDALWLQRLRKIGRKDPILCTRRCLCSVGNWYQSHPEDSVTYVLE